VSRASRLGREGSGAGASDSRVSAAARWIPEGLAQSQPWFTKSYRNDSSDWSYG
jgi:hypothetical protein